MKKSLWIILAWTVSTSLAIAAINDGVLGVGSEVTLGSDTFIVQSRDSMADYFVVNSDNFTINVSSGGAFLEISSADRRTFTVDSSVYKTFFECTASRSLVRIEVPSTASTTVTVTPASSGTCSSDSGGGGGGGGGGGSSGGGGGGGGSGTVVTPVATTPAPTTQVVTTQTTVATPSVSVSLTQDLAKGSENAEVTQLQQLLASDPTLYPEGLVTGYFGAATERAVKAFQKKHSLPTVGKVGPMTRAKLQEVFGSGTAPSSVTTPVSAVPVSAPSTPLVLTQGLGRGSKGDDVKTLQQWLTTDATIYPEGVANGNFGPLTEKAVQRFQEKYGLAQSGESGYGYVGPKTRAKLQEVFGGAMPQSSSNNSALEVQLQAAQKQLQELLKQIGQ